MKVRTEQFYGQGAMMRSAAGYVVSCARSSVEERGVFSLVLAGGGTPAPLYEALAGPPFSDHMPWRHTHLFWGDERCVPRDHPSSNYGMVSSTLLDRGLVPGENIHPMPGSRQCAEDDVLACERELRGFFAALAGEDGDARGADCILLGVGSDGHTASLFPGAPALGESERWVVGADAPDGVDIRRRLTVTLPFISLADRVLFLVSGEGKAGVVRNILARGEEGDVRLPASLVRARREVVWYVDFQLGGDAR